MSEQSSDIFPQHELRKDIVEEYLPEDASDSSGDTQGVQEGSERLEQIEQSEGELIDAIKSEDDSVELENGSKTLEEALAKYQIELSPKKVRLLKEYCELLWTWNERLNLTRHTTFDKFVARDLVDSIRIANQLQKGEHVLDVGSGGGVPGLVVAILRPDVIVELCDATGKKAEALGAIVDALDLDLNVWYAKAEDLLKTRHFHTLTIRAVSKMRSLLLMFAPVWHTFDRILMIKGPNWLAERGEARHYNMFNSLALRKVDEYENPENPGLEHASVILQICRKTRMEEMERRAKERAQGLPYDGEIEDIVVDNRPRDISEPKDRRRSEIGRSFPRKKESGFSTRSNRDNSNSVSSEATSRQDFQEKASGARPYGRNAAKAPKGWTGKKSEFKSTHEHGEQQNVDSGNKRRFSGRSKSNAGFSKKGPSRNNGGNYNKRSSNND